MPTTLNNWGMTPPGLWRYRIEGIADPVIAWVTGFYAYNDLEAETLRRMKANGIPAPPDLRQRVVDQLCPQLPPEWCNDGTLMGRVGAAFSHEFTRVMQGTTTLIDWWVSADRAKVPQEEADRRASICSTCPFNSQPAGCTTCNRGVLATLAAKVVGGQPTRHDASLQACSICGCELKAKVWLPLEVLRRHLSTGQMAQFPPPHTGFPGCWLREEATP